LGDVYTMETHACDSVSHFAMGLNGPTLASRLQC
jgi:hypothetical protein